MTLSAPPPLLTAPLVSMLSVAPPVDDPVPIVTAPTFQPRTPVLLFQKANGGYDVAADGQRFFMAALPEDAGSPPLSMIVNWTALLKKAEPAR